MTGANCAICLSILVPLLGVIVALVVIFLAPKGSRRRRVAFVALFIGVIIMVVWTSLYFSVLGNMSSNGV